MIPSSHGHPRPSPRELARKLLAARALVSSAKWAPAEPVKLGPDLRRFGMFTAQEQGDGILTALREIGPADYIGKRPPEKAYERRVYGREMFAFRWDSKCFGRLMYLKFCITPDALYIVSLHESHKEG